MTQDSREHNVFISYAFADQEIADALVEVLEQKGVRCWIARRDQQLGDIFTVGLLDAIAQSQALVLLLSPAANTSDHVRRECCEASGKSIPIFTIRLKDVPPSRELGYYIREYHWFDAFSQPLPESLDRFAEKVAQRLRQKKIIEADPRIPAKPMFGRDEDISAILSLLAQRPLAVTGIKGIGKSKVVSAVFERIIEDGGFPFRTLYWRRLNYDEPPPFTSFGRRLLNDLKYEDLDFDQKDPSGQVEQVIRVMKNRRCCLFIDQFEAVVNRETRIPKDKGFALFLTFLNQGLDKARALLTSWEVPKDSQGIPLAHYALDGLDTRSGGDFIESMAGRGVFKGREDLKESIVASLKGHPYALELIVKNYSPREIAQMVGDKALWRKQIHEIASSLVSKIYDRLRPESKKVLQAACIFFKPVDKEALSAVSEVREIILLISDLRQRGLITEVQEGQYDIHILVKDYVLGATPDEEKIRLHIRAAEYYRRLPCPPPGARKTIEDVFPLLDAIEHLISAEKEGEAADLFTQEKLHDELYGWSYLSALEHIYGRFLDKTISDENLSIFLGNQGIVIRDLGDLNRAKDLYEQALEAARRCGHKLSEITQLINLGDVFHYLGDYDRSLYFHSRAAELLKSHPEAKLEARNTGCLGNVFLATGESEKAKDHYLRAVAMCRQIGERRYEGIWLGDLANIYGRHIYDEANLNLAFQHYDQAIEIAIETHDRRHESWWYGILGNLYYSLGQYEAAEKNLERALSLSEKVNYRRGIVYQLKVMRDLYLARSEISRAIDCCEKLVRVAREMKNAQEEFATMSSIVDLRARDGQLDKAIDGCLALLDRVKSEKDKRQEGHFLLKLADLYLKIDEPDKAFTFIEEAKALGTDGGDQEYAVRTQGRIKEILDANFEKIAGIVDSLLKTIDEAQGTGKESEVMEASHRLGAIYELMELSSSASRLYSRALDIAKKHHLPDQVKTLLIKAARVSLSLYEFERAEACYDELMQIAAQSGDIGSKVVFKEKLAEVLLAETADLVRNEQYERVIEKSRKALALSPESAAAYHCLGQAYQNLWKRNPQAGLLDKGIEAHTQEIHLKPQSSAYHGRANCHAYRGDLEEAIRDYTEALKLDASNMAAALSKIEVLIWQGRYAEARKTYEAVRERILSPQDKVLSSWLMSLALAFEGMPFEKYFQEFKKAPDVLTTEYYDPRDIEPYLPALKSKKLPKSRMNNIAKIQEELVRHYRPAEKKDELGEIMRRLRAVPILKEAEFFFKKGDLEKGIERCSRAITVDPTFAAAFSERGRIYRIIAYTPELSEHYLDLAIRDFSEVIRLNPEDDGAYMLRAGAYSQKGHLEPAIRDYQKSIELNPGNIMARLGKMETEICLGRHEDACRTSIELSAAGRTLKQEVIASALVSVALALRGEPFEGHSAPLLRDDVILSDKHDWCPVEIDKYLEKLEREGFDKERLAKAKEIWSRFKRLFK
jgi:tetratricopeptide (TPR) repeat protein